MALTDAELRQYEELGAVTIDSPFTSAELDRAEAAWDRLTASGRPPYDDPDYLDVFQHPYFEEVARKLLRADAAHLWWGVSPHGRQPAKAPFGSIRDQWASGCHTDIQATWDDFQATPRRMRAELWFWLNDVPEHRGAMRILPGSHRPIMEYWSRVLTPEHKAMLPRVHGVRPESGRRHGVLSGACARPDRCAVAGSGAGAHGGPSRADADSMQFRPALGVAERGLRASKGDAFGMGRHGRFLRTPERPAGLSDGILSPSEGKTAPRSGSHRSGRLRLALREQLRAEVARDVYRDIG